MVGVTSAIFGCPDCGATVHAFFDPPVRVCLECRAVRSVEPQYRAEIWRSFHGKTPMPAHLETSPVEPMFPTKEGP